MNDPIRMTVLERWADDVLRFENFERYSAQSSATACNVLGTLPARDRQRYDHGGPRSVVPFELRRGT